MASLDDIKKKIGDPTTFVPSPEKIPLLRQWAVIAGHGPLLVYNMTAAQLANLYTDSDKGGGERATDEQLRELSGKLFFEIMQTVSVPGFNVDVTRQLTREETLRHMQSDEMRPILLECAKACFATLPPKQLQVITPQATGIIDGPLHKSTELIIRIAALGHNVMMVGPAGCGKTTIAEHAAKALALPFYITNAIQETHQLSGFIDGYGRYHPTPFRYAFEYGGLWVADEIDAWDASALLAANSALANGFMAFPDRAEPVNKHHAFRMIATANTFGTGADRVYIGRNQLDAASLDRFAMVEIDYDTDLERMFANGNTSWLEYVQNVRRAVEKTKVRHVVSSRAISSGSVALQAGLTFDQVKNIYLFKGMSKTDRQKVMEAIA